MLLISVKKFAGRMGVAPDTVTRWVRQGLIKPTVRTIGGHARFDADAPLPQPVKEKPMPAADRPRVPWTPRRVWRSSSEPWPPSRDVRDPPVGHRALNKFFEERYQANKLDPTQAACSYNGEANWRSRRRSQEYAAARIENCTEGTLIVGQFTRAELHEEIWRVPLVVVAQQLGLSDNGLRKICKNYQIKMPPRGYWMAVRAGKKRPKPKLAPLKQPKCKPVIRS